MTLRSLLGTGSVVVLGSAAAAYKFLCAKPAAKGAGLLSHAHGGGSALTNVARDAGGRPVEIHPRAEHLH